MRRRRARPQEQLMLCIAIGRQSSTTLQTHDWCERDGAGLVRAGLVSSASLRSDFPIAATRRRVESLMNFRRAFACSSLCYLLLCLLLVVLCLAVRFIPVAGVVAIVANRCAHLQLSLPAAASGASADQNKSPDYTHNDFCHHYALPFGRSDIP